MHNRTLLILGTLSGWMLFAMVLYYSNTSLLQTKTDATVRSGTIHPREDSSTGTVDKNPIPGQAQLEMMTEEQLETLLHTYVSSPQTTCSAVVRMGKIRDGGWEVCLDPRYAPEPSNCLVYSFGIKNEFSFDDAMENYGCEVHSFDPSMTASTDHLRGQRVHFHLEGVDGKNAIRPVGKYKWNLYTIGTLRSRHGHAIGQRRIDVLKMDVEGTERETLPEAIRTGSLSDIPQICYEMHHQTNRNMNLKHLAILRDLYDRGMRIYLTNRNLNCVFTSKVTGISRTHCHEVYMVNVTLAR